MVEFKGAKLLFSNLASVSRTKEDRMHCPVLTNLRPFVLVNGARNSGLATNAAQISVQRKRGPALVVASAIHCIATRGKKLSAEPIAGFPEANSVAPVWSGVARLTRKSRRVGYTRFAYGPAVVDTPKHWQQIGIESSFVLESCLGGRATEGSKVTAASLDGTSCNTNDRSHSDARWISVVMHFFPNSFETDQQLLYSDGLLVNLPTKALHCSLFLVTARPSYLFRYWFSVATASDTPNIFGFFIRIPRPQEAP